VKWCHGHSTLCLPLFRCVLSSLSVCLPLCICQSACLPAYLSPSLLLFLSSSLPLFLPSSLPLFLFDLLCLLFLSPSLPSRSPSVPPCPLRSPFYVSELPTSGWVLYGDVGLHPCHGPEPKNYQDPPSRRSFRTGVQFVDSLHASRCTRSLFLSRALRLSRRVFSSCSTLNLLNLLRPSSCSFLSWDRCWRTRRKAIIRPLA
jgi:hypothetical protein